MKLLIALLLASISLQATEASKRILAHCAIRDYQTACEEGQQLITTYPSDKELWQAYIRAHAEAGNEKEMLLAYKNYEKKFPELDRSLLETMSWGILNNGAKSPSPLVRIITMMASFYTQDARGVAILHRNLFDHNTLLRNAAVELSSQMRDSKLQQAMQRLLQEERNPDLRVEVISALGKMHVKDAKSDLLAIVSSNTSTSEEKAAATQALVTIFDEVTRDEIQRLAKSDRAALRFLACQLVAEQESEMDLIKPLIQDSHSEVRIGAIVALGQLNTEIPASMSDPDDRVQIHIAWALTRQKSPQGIIAFEKLLNHSDRKIRLDAAAALASCGHLGLELMQKAFLTHSDPLVKMNLALGLIGQRIMVDQAGEALAQGLNQIHERLMWHEEPAFKALVISDVSHNPLMPQYPEAVNQMTRLEILNVLAILSHPKAQEVMRQFLEQKPWGVTGMATALMLTEGDDEAVGLIESLLNDSQPRIRIQAALVLALWGRSEKAISTLEKSYEGASRELREKIIEGLGRIGSATSIPFLLDRLEEPSQTLRVIAAMAMLQCLYH